MSRVCCVCGKVIENGTPKRVKVCTRCLRSNKVDRA